MMERKWSFSATSSLATVAMLAIAGMASGASPVGDGTVATVGRCLDVALSPGGVLRGVVQSEPAGPRSGSLVAILQDGREVACATTDTAGAFQISGLRGGTYTLVSPNSTANIRVWGEGAAPPSATSSILLVDQGTVIRGNGAGGALWRTVSNPWVSATAIAAAIAVPIALNNNDSGS